MLPCYIVTILTRIDKTSLGMSRIGVAIPWDDWPYGQSNANTFVRARAYRSFPDLVCRDQPQGVPLVEPSTLGGKIQRENPIRTRLPQALLQWVSHSLEPILLIKHLLSIIIKMCLKDRASILVFMCGDYSGSSEQQIKATTEQQYIKLSSANYSSTHILPTRTPTYTSRVP